MSDLADDVLETLLLPIKNGDVPRPDDGILFLRARAGAALSAQRLPQLECVQTFKPEADKLLHAGLQLVTSPTKQYSLVMILPPRQRDEARALMAQAIAHCKPDGRVLAAVANSEGARSSEKDLGALTGPLNCMSKNKCRVFWTQDLSHVQKQLLSTWRELDAPRRIVDQRFLSRPGVFAWDRIDPASALLANELPSNLSGRAADLGAGFGYLAVELLTRCSQITSLDIYEAEARALDLARENLRAFETRVAINYRWHDVTTGLKEKYDVIVTNPPFHTQSRSDRPDIGRSFIAAAAAALSPNGVLWLVANRHLPYEQILNDSFGEVRIVAQRDGFKVIAAIKSAR